MQEWGLLKKIYLYSFNCCRHYRHPFEHFQIEMLVCFFADSFRVRFSNFVSLWCFSLRFRGGRSATTGLTFIPCPHWVLRPHLNCLTLWGRLSETFSAQKPQMATFTTCWLVPIFVKSRSLSLFSCTQLNEEPTAAVSQCNLHWDSHRRWVVWNL